MKTLTLAALLTISAITSYAQVIDKNQKILGGSISMNLSNVEVDTSTKDNDFSLTLSPGFGFAIKKNLVFGAAVTVGLQNGDYKQYVNDYTIDQKGHTIGGRIFIEKFVPFGKSFSFSVNGGISGSVQKAESNTSYPTSKSKIETTQHGVGFSAYPAINYSLNKKFLLQIYFNDLVYVSHYKYESKQSGTNMATKESTNTGTILGTSLNQAKVLHDLSFSFRYIF